MTEITPDQVAEEANLIAEYAKLDDAFSFDAEYADNPNHCTLIWAKGQAKALVDMPYAMGNLRNCPDRCTKEQLLLAIAAAHPDKKVCSAKVHLPDPKDV